MRNAHQTRRQAEMAAADLDFDYFEDTIGVAGDRLAVDTLDGVTELADLFAEIAEIDAALAELDGPVAPVVPLFEQNVIVGGKVAQGKTAAMLALLFGEVA
ncbi:hypothetical protein [Amycolatopsis sp. DSM 110486]|uniref:hypothetical protein n=1 Tax=Amycolatopsis sp. DSM 110486 TaxID=2865832 RepID=UPI00210505E2|nr:hypothetical protein [Amycolatopsis sp. DSM 110486]